MGFFLFTGIIMSTIKKRINKSVWEKLGLHLGTADWSGLL